MGRKTLVKGDELPREGPRSLCVNVVRWWSDVELRVAFAMVDKDGDGRITPRELMSVMTGLGFKSDDVLVKEMIARFDADGI